MKLRIVIAILLIFCVATSVFAAEFSTKIFKAAAIGVAVKSTGTSINKFINTFTLNNNIPIGMSTKVVPILSVGEKGYVGAAQVAGPKASVNSVQAVWLYENNFSNNEFRLKVLVPSASLNPLTLKKVQKVGVTAIIDVSLDGRWKGQTFSNSVRAGDVLKAGVVAVAINAAAKPLNKAINIITHGDAAGTKVVPIVTIGDKAYIGGVQVSGSASAISKVKAVYQYEAIYSSGRYRIKVFVPSNSTNPLKIKRVSGIGITALIDTSIADQKSVKARQQYWSTYKPRYPGINDVLKSRFKGDIVVVQPKKDQGLHKGFYIGKGNQKKQLTGIWIGRYKGMSSNDREAFVVFWNAHYKEKPGDLDKHWNEWLKKRQGNDKKVKIQVKSQDKGHSKGKHK